MDSLQKHGHSYIYRCSPLSVGADLNEPSKISKARAVKEFRNICAIIIMSAHIAKENDDIMYY